MKELEDEKQIDTINTSINIDKEMIPIVDQLINIGYSKLYSKRLIAYYHPKTIDEALNYFLKENGQIQHFFIEDKKRNNKNYVFYVEKKKKFIWDIFLKI